MSSSPLVIPLFITHRGCPHRCIFCDQHAITAIGAGEPDLSPAGARESIDLWLARPRKDPTRKVQVAFYGGSFTAMAPEYQRELLNAVQPYLNDGRIAAIRLSTRPDAVGPETVALLRENGVTVVELGVQSLQEKVLAASRRGHTGADVARAVSALRQAGMTVGVQLMIGLPGDTTADFIDTVKKTVALAPDFVRLYPTVVLQKSGLAALAAAGKYTPLTLNRGVVLAGRAKKIFASKSIPVVRMGLQPSLELESKIVAGAYHPAFGELVISRLFFKTARRLLAAAQTRQGITVAPEDESAMRGQNNKNIKRLIGLDFLEEKGLKTVPGQPRFTVSLAADSTFFADIFSDAENGCNALKM